MDLKVRIAEVLTQLTVVSNDLKFCIEGLKKVIQEPEKVSEELYGKDAPNDPAFQKERIKPSRIIPFLKAMRKEKERVGRIAYYLVLKRHTGINTKPYQKANEVILREHQEKIYKELNLLPSGAVPPTDMLKKAKAKELIGKTEEIDKIVNDLCEKADTTVDQLDCLVTLQMIYDAIDQHAMNEKGLT